MPCEGEAVRGGVIRTEGQTGSRQARRKAAQDASAEQRMAVGRPAAASPRQAPFLTCLFLIVQPPALALPLQGASLPSPPQTLECHLHALPAVPTLTPPDVAARRVAWDGLWLYVLRNFRDAPEQGSCALEGRDDRRVVDPLQRSFLWRE